MTKLSPILEYTQVVVKKGFDCEEAKALYELYKKDKQFTSQVDILKKIKGVK